MSVNESTSNPGEVEQAISEALEAAEIFVAVERDGDRLVLSGEVSTREERDAALDIANAAAAARGLTVDDGMDLTPVFPETVSTDEGDQDRGAFGYLESDRNFDGELDAGLEEEPDFERDVGTTDAIEASDQGVPYTPPTDPIFRPT